MVLLKYINNVRTSRLTTLSIANNKNNIIIFFDRICHTYRIRPNILPRVTYKFCDLTEVYGLTSIIILKLIKYMTAVKKCFFLSFSAMASIIIFIIIPMMFNGCFGKLYALYIISYGEGLNNVLCDIFIFGPLAHTTMYVTDRYNRSLHSSRNLSLRPGVSAFQLLVPYSQFQN